MIPFDRDVLKGRFKGWLSRHEEAWISAYREAKSDRRVARRETTVFSVLKISERVRIDAGAPMRGICR